MNSAASQNPHLYKLVVSHYLISALCFVSLAVMLLFAAPNLTGHYFHPQLLAITHMAALGWGTMVIIGAVYQLLPVILDTGLYSYKTAWLSLVLFITGLVLFVYSLWNFDPGIFMQSGSLLLLAGISLFGTNVFLTAKKNRDDIHQEFIVTSCIWLVATALLGTLLVFNFRYAFFQKDHILFLKLHAHMGLAGWFLMLICGVSSKLIPMFMVSKKQKPSLLSWSFYLINGGLVFFLIDAYFSGLNFKTYIAASVTVAGIACWLVFIAGCVRSRMRKRIDISSWHSLVSFILLGTAIVILPFILFDHIEKDPAAVKYTLLYGSLLIMGWITSLILGQTFKTLPFIVWLRHYQLRAGNGDVPLPADIFKDKLLKIQFGLFLIFIVIFYAGIFLKSAILINAGLACFLAVSLAYLSNVLIVVFHRPQKEL